MPLKIGARRRSFRNHTIEIFNRYNMKSIGKRRKKPAVGFGIETVGVREQNRAPARIRPFEARHRAISEIDGRSHRI